MSSQHNKCERIPPPPKGRKAYANSPNVESILQESTKLDSSEKFSLVMELIKTSNFQPSEMTKIINTLSERKRAEKKGSSEHQRTDDSRDLQLSSTSFPASKVSVIVNGHLIQPNTALALDMEKIIDKTHTNLAGDFSLVDLKGTLIMWCYIKREDVCRFNTKLTGLDAEKVKNGLNPETVREILSKILMQNTLVGADLANDLKSLGYDKEVHLPEGTVTDDIQDFYKDQRGGKISLAQLGTHFLGSEFQTSAHSSIKDARVTAICYNIMTKFKKDGVTKFNCPEFLEYREQQLLFKKSQKPAAFDKCTCGLTKIRNNKKPWSSFSNVPLL